MDHVTQITGAVVISAFMALNVLAMYLYLRRHISLDPRSETNHAIAQRFDSVEELQEFHAQEGAAVRAKANAALQRYRQAMSREMTAMDPVKASSYPIPNKSFDDLV